MTSITPAATAAQAMPDGKIRQAAEDFTAVALNELLSPMFDSVDTAGGPFGGGPAEAQWKPLLVQDIAKQIAHSGGFGLIEPVYQQMLRLQETRR